MENSGSDDQKRDSASALLRLPVDLEKEAHGVIGRRRRVYAGFYDN